MSLRVTKKVLQNLLALVELRLMACHTRVANEIRKEVVAGNSNQCTVAIGVVDADRHAHARARFGIGRGVARAGQHFVEVGSNGTGLDHAEAVEIEHRHFAERMTCQVLGLTGLAGEHVDWHLTILGSLAGQDHSNRAHIRAAAESIQCDVMWHRQISSARASPGVF
jgi:hypothetical protein